VREKQLKHWNRAWKIRLIEEQNPTWDDLYDELRWYTQAGGTPPKTKRPANAGRSAVMGV
jgi:putative endonuclease